jgi:hypothetical protein
LVKRQASVPELGVHSGLLITELVGRERDFRVIIRAWDRAQRGPSTQLHIVGEAGLGKSRLLRDAAARLRASGARIVTIQPDQGGQHLDYSVAADLAGALGSFPEARALSPAAAATLLGMNPALSNQFTGLTEPGNSDDVHLRRSLAVAELVRTLAAHSPLAIFLDDYHWVDQRSRRLLEYVVGRTDHARILVVTASRPHTGSLSPSAGGELVQVAPLSLENTQSLLASAGRLPPDPWASRLAEALWKTSGGSPLLILEALRLAMEQGVLDLRDGDWRCANAEVLWPLLEAGAALRRRLGNLREGPRETILTLALAGVPLSAMLIADVTRRPADQVQLELDHLEGSGLAVRVGELWRTAHDEVAAQAITTAAADERARLHSSIGVALMEAPGERSPLLAQAAQHLLVAGERRRLAVVFHRWMTRRRAAGMRTTPANHARELLGELATPAVTKELVRSLPLRERWGFVGPAAAVVILVATVLGAMNLARSNIRNRRPEASVVVSLPAGADSIALYEVAAGGNDWPVERQLDVSAAGRRLPIALSRWAAQGVPASRPSGGAWVISKVFPDSGGIDLALVDARGKERRLTSGRSDDTEPTWSPDGSSIAFVSSRFSQSHWYGLAVLDVASGTVRGLPEAGFIHHSPKWSPDGSRIAYTRARAGGSRSEACWVSVDGAQRGCLDTTISATSQVVGWFNDRELIVHHRTSNTSWLSVQSLTGAAAHQELRTDMVGLEDASAYGQWVAARDTRRESATHGWVLFKLSDPTAKYRITMASTQAPPIEVAVGPARVPRERLDSLRIVAPYSNTVPMGAPTLLRALGYTYAGDTARAPFLRWELADTTRARIDGTGFIHPRDTGDVTVYATAGGWQSDSLVVSIRRPRPRRLLDEHWTMLDSARWYLAGQPLPILTMGTGGPPALWIRGDESFLSAAYSTQLFDARRGIALSAHVSTPITSGAWQQLIIGFITGLDGEGLQRWDRQSSNAPGRREAYPMLMCGVEYPDGNGTHSDRLRTLGAPALTAPVPEWTRTGRWYRVIVQLFPDGTCGVALDGKALARTTDRIPTEPGFRVALEAKSVRTRMLVGPLQVWEGISSEVDWTLRDR